MKFLRAGIVKGLPVLVFVAMTTVAAGCSTDSGMKNAGSAHPGEEADYLSAAGARNDPDRIICRRHRPNSSHISEKICMTARQWHQAGEDTAHSNDRALHSPDSIEGN